MVCEIETDKVKLSKCNTDSFFLVTACNYFLRPYFGTAGLKRVAATIHQLKSSQVTIYRLYFILNLLYSQTSVQVPAPAAGVIEELLVPDGGKVEGGTPLFKLRKGGFKYFIFYFYTLFG